MNPLGMTIAAWTLLGVVRLIWIGCNGELEELRNELVSARWTEPALAALPREAVNVIALVVLVVAWPVTFMTVPVDDDDEDGDSKEG